MEKWDSHFSPLCMSDGLVGLLVVFGSIYWDLVVIQLGPDTLRCSALSRVTFAAIEKLVSGSLSSLDKSGSSPLSQARVVISFLSTGVLVSVSTGFFLPSVLSTRLTTVSSATATVLFTQLSSVPFFREGRRE